MIIKSYSKELGGFKNFIANMFPSDAVKVVEQYTLGKPLSAVITKPLANGRNKYYSKSLVSSILTCSLYSTPPVVQKCLFTSESYFRQRLHATLSSYTF